MSASPKVYLRKAAVLHRYGDRSHTWIKRAQTNDGFPDAAMFVSGRPLWLLDDLDQWDAAQALKPKPKRNDMAHVRAAIGLVQS